MVSSDSMAVIRDPVCKELADDIVRLRTEVSMLVSERDELQYTVCRNIEADYMLKIGSLECRAYEIDCSIRRLRRKIQLIQAKKNRNEKVYVEEIEKILDEEFEGYQKELDERIGKMNDALNRKNQELLTSDESKELKSLYFMIVKRLHPDLNPDLGDSEKELYLNAVAAYKRGDLLGLRAIADMIGDKDLKVCGSDERLYLTDEKARLESIAMQLKDEVLAIRGRYPYTMLSLLNDPHEVAVRRTELEKMIEDLEKAFDIYRDKVRAISNG